MVVAGGGYLCFVDGDYRGSIFALLHFDRFMLLLHNSPLVESRTMHFGVDGFESTHVLRIHTPFLKASPSATHPRTRVAR